MARYVADGVLDAGLTGIDWIAEHAAAIHHLDLFKASGTFYIEQPLPR